MPVAGAGGVNFDIEADPHDLGAERGFREGRAADIAKTDEQHGRFSGMSCDPPWSLSDTIFPTLAHGMGDVPRSKRPVNFRAILKRL